MEPLTLISGAMALADATGLSGWIGKKLGGNIGEATASKITSIASSIAGGGSIEDTLARIKADSELAGELKKQLMANEHELVLAYLDDVKSARQMYQETDHVVADKLAVNIMSRNLWFILILVLLNIGTVALLPNPANVALVSNIIGICIGWLWSERSQVVGFFFGSSQGSKDKSKAMSSAITSSVKK